MTTENTGFVVSALYKFVTIDQPEQLRAPLLQLMQRNQVRGTLILANEGINGTIAGPREGIDSVIQWLKSQPFFADLGYKESFDDKQPFMRAKVKLKKEIVTMGVEGIDPKEVVGRYVKPAEWNRLISDPEVLLIDTRNDYEIQIGSFKGAVNPKTESFREFPAYVSKHLDKDKHRKVAMFCTGGIRCEKSTAYLRQQGFDEVYHLEGGILKYLEEVPEENSLWQGQCFVFDNRVAVDHQLQKGDYALCHACRMPITAEQMSSPEYLPGICCPHCHDKLSPDQRQRFAEREKQVRLARERGEAHLGEDALSDSQQRRAKKQAERERQRQPKKKPA